MGGGGREGGREGREGGREEVTKTSLVLGLVGAVLFCDKNLARTWSTLLHVEGFGLDVDSGLVWGPWPMRSIFKLQTRLGSCERKQCPLSTHYPRTARK